MNPCGFCRQLGASLVKNWRLKKREVTTTLLELLLPVIFIGGLVGGWGAATITTHPALQYMSMPISKEYILSQLSQPRPPPNGTQQPVQGIPTLPPEAVGSYFYDSPAFYVSLLFCYKGPVPLQPYVTTPCPIATNVTCLESYNIEDICFAGSMTNPAFSSVVASTCMAVMELDKPSPLPSLDVLILLHIAARASLKDKRGFNAGSFSSLMLPVGFIVTPISDEAKLMVSHLNASSYFFPKVFKGVWTESAASDYAYSLTGADTVMAVIHISSYKPSKLELKYELRVNRTRLPLTTDTRQFFAGGLGSRPYAMYWASGFTTIQQELHGAMLKSRGISPIPLAATPMPTDSYKDSEFLTAAGSLVPFLVVLGFMYPVAQLVKRLVEEKELRIREGMMIMGLGRAAFYGSWFITYTVMQFITAVLCTLLLDYTIYDLGNGFIIWLIFMLFGLSTIMFSLLMSTFFSSSRVAALTAPIVFCAVSIPVFAISSTQSSGTYTLMSLLSPSAFSLALRTITNYEMLRGFQPEDISNSADVVSVGSSIGMLILDTFLYLFLALYLDVVWPSQWGTRLHPCFCFMPSYWCKKKKTEEPKSMERRSSVVIAKEKHLIEEVEPTMAPSIQIQKLKKVFRINGQDRIAVDDLELNLYPDQVSVILGHNGAGKTTTINMITGMMDMTSGDCEVYGRTISSDMNAIRQDIGLCPQHNILWNELTCREHLDFYATIKGMSGPSKEEAIIRFLNAVELSDKENTYAGNLSGGQKRKLSVAIAFIGQSRVVILDEPTAGMDVEARRSTWELIREMTPGRTIILTTHFMDEADILGHTVTIMSKGRLHCSGSPMFLKSRLGVGYTLSLDLAPSSDQAKIKSNIMEVVPSCHFLTNSDTMMTYRLPMDTVKKFSDLFRMLEVEGTAIGVQSFGINVTTLEEIFIRIAMAEEEGLEEDTKTDAQPDNHEAGTIYSVWDHPEDLAEHENASFMRQFVALLLKRIHNARRDRRAQCFQIVLPILFVLLALFLGTLGPPPVTPLEIDPRMYGKSQILALSNCSTQIRSNIDSYYKIEVDPKPTDWAINFSTYLLETHNKHKDERMVGIACDDAKIGRTLLFMNSTGLHSLPEAILAYTKAYATSVLSEKVTISATSHPLDFTVRDSVNIRVIQAMLTAIFILIPFTFVPSVYTAWLVKERETKAKHLQLVSGLNVNAFWVSNLVWDFVSYLLTEFLALALFGIFQKDELIGPDAAGATFLLFLLYGFSGIGLSYLVHFLFSNHSTAQNIVMLVNFFVGFACVIVVMILSFIESTKDASDALRYIFRFIPAYCLGEGLINIATVSAKNELGLNLTAYDWDVVGIPFVYMALEFPCFFILTILFDNPFWLRSQQLMQYDTDQDGDHTDTSHEDVDVAKERKEVMEGRPEDLVTVKNLRKVFPTPAGPKVAVRYVTFGVKRAEIFGFLGTNGAGKTTTLSILSGEFPPSSGDGWIHGHNVVTHCAAARRHLGYCPQFDALIDLLTPREHLNLYSALRGVPSHRVAESVENLIKAACLEMYADQPSQGLSGGNKRKLSLALALIGGPPVIFLDEPSAGMDPVARRSLWGTIRSLAKGRSVVLTTHHLEEVEALAQRVTIMDRGEMKCIGSLQHLKHKYGDGYELTAKVLAERDIDPLISFVTSHLSHASVEEIHGMRVTFMLPQQATVLSTVFEIIEGSKAALNVTDYSITQTSLEQVFMRIAQSGMDETHQSTNVHRASRPVVPHAHVEAAPVF